MGSDQLANDLVLHCFKKMVYNFDIIMHGKKCLYRI